MPKTALILGHPIAEEANSLFRANGIEPIARDPEFTDLSTFELVDKTNPHAIVLREGALDANSINCARELKVICKHGVGIDSIDVGAATAQSIPVMVTTGANAMSVAEHTLTLTLCTLKNVAHLDNRVRNGHWDKTNHIGKELTGKRIGLIGYGRIAQAFTRLLQPFNVSVMAYVRDLDRTSHDHVTFTENLEDVLATCDVISLHCPLDKTTESIIGRKELASMKNDVTIINTARGRLIDEVALFDALNSGRIYGVGLDCLQEEPPARLEGLLQHPAVVVTPHVAWSTIEARRNMGVMAAKNVIAVLSEQPLPPDRTVNFRSLMPRNKHPLVNLA